MSLRYRTYVTVHGLHVQHILCALRAYDVIV